MMFKDAGFICRKCITWFMITHENFSAVRRAGELVCPECGQKASGRTVQDFFKTYSMFGKNQERLAEDGFILKEIYAEEIKSFGKGLKKFDIKGITVTCTHCDQDYAGGISDADADHTGLIQCFDCGARPRPIVFTEFFETLAHINDLQQNLADHFQLELFSCRDIDPQTLLGENNDAQSDLQ